MTTVSEIQVQAVRDLIAGAEKRGRETVSLASLKLVLLTPELVEAELEKEPAAAPAFVEGHRLRVVDSRADLDRAEADYNGLLRERGE